MEEPAIVLKTQAYRDADLIVSLLAKDSGKISALALRARHSKKRFLGGIDLFDCGVFEFTQSKTGKGLLRVQGLRNREIWSSLRSNFEALMFGSALLEATERLVGEQDPDGAKLFEPLFRSLRALNQNLKPGAAASIAAYYLLLLSQSSGVDILETDSEFSEDTKSWLRKMNQEQSPWIPLQAGLALKGSKEILCFLGQSFGIEFKVLLSLDSLS